MNYSTRREQVAAEVRAEMARQRISLTELADATSISPSTLRRRLDSVSPFDVDELDRVAGALGVSPDQLFARGAVA